MKVKKCNICGNKLIKNGKTKSGKQRWYCKKCKGSQALKYDKTIKKFNNLLIGYLKRMLYQSKTFLLEHFLEIIDCIENIEQCRLYMTKK